MFINPQVTKPLESYEQIFDTPKYRKQILLNTPKNTQSVLMLIVATALTTSKPLRRRNAWSIAAGTSSAMLRPMS